MIKDEVKNVSKLNDFDRHILLQYSDISLETGTRITAEATDIKTTIHKSYKMKV